MKAFLAPALIVLLGWSATPMASARPAELPVPNDIECAATSDDPVPGRFSVELDFSAKGITLKLGLQNGNPPQPAPAIDAVSPSLLPMYVSDLFGRFTDAVMNWRSNVLAPMLDTPQRDGAEEQTETPNSDASFFRQMREQSIPLGLVEVVY